MRIITTPVQAPRANSRTSTRSPPDMPALLREDAGQRHDRVFESNRPSTRPTTTTTSPPQLPAAPAPPRLSSRRPLPEADHAPAPSSAASSTNMSGPLRGPGQSRGQVLEPHTRF
jgi:hypothetical protein